MKSGTTVQDVIDELNKIENKEMLIEGYDRDGPTGGIHIYVMDEDDQGDALPPEKEYLIINSDW
jgi:hypothetical protein